MKVQICKGISCLSRGSAYVEKRLMADVERLNYENVEIESCLCQGNCPQWPTLIIGKEMISYSNPVVASEALRKRIENFKSKSTWKQEQ